MGALPYRKTRREWTPALSEDVFPAKVTGEIVKEAERMALIGIDLGTSGTKTVLFDEAGTSMGTVPVALAEET